MNSALTPREIQTRIRSGESLEEVAQAAGVPIEKVEPFAAPVIAEREHVASTALTSPVRRNGEAGNHRTLRQVVSERLLSRGLDIDDVEWDAWRVAERKWAVTGTYQSGSATRVAEFRYDQLGRFSIAQNDDARWLINESTPAHGPQPHRRRRSTDDPDAEPTVDFTDEFALVNAVGVAVEPAPAEVAEQELPTGFDLGEDTELAQVGGVYDIVPRVSQLDMLYDMFHSLNEDSVEIYPGLAQTQPVGAGAPEPEPAPVEQGEVPELEGEVLVTDPQTQAQADEYDPEPAVEPVEKKSRRQRRRSRSKVDETQVLQLEQPALDEADEPEAPTLPPQDAPDDVVTEMESEPQTAPAAAPAPAEPLLRIAVPADSEPLPETEPEPQEAEPPAADDAVSDEPEAKQVLADAPPVEPAPVLPAPKETVPTVPTEPDPDEQTLDVAEPAEPVTKKPARKPEPEDEETVVVPRTRSRKKRASVPSWDEIMFGAPAPKPPRKDS